MAIRGCSGRVGVEWGGMLVDRNRYETNGDKFVQFTSQQAHMENVLAPHKWSPATWNCPQLFPMVQPPTPPPPMMIMFSKAMTTMTTTMTTTAATRATHIRHMFHHHVLFIAVDREIIREEFLIRIFDIMQHIRIYVQCSTSLNTIIHDEMRCTRIFMLAKPTASNATQ